MTRRQQQQQNRHQDQQSKVLYELSALVLSLLRSPPAPIPFTDQSPEQSRRPPSSTSTNTITPAGFAFLMLGISVALMLCGSVTFFIGFMLMPWVIGLVMVFYVAGIVSTVSMLGRSILYSVKAHSSPRKEVPGSFIDKVGCPGWQRGGESGAERMKPFQDKTSVAAARDMGGTKGPYFMDGTELWSKKQNDILSVFISLFVLCVVRIWVRIF